MVLYFLFSCFSLPLGCKITEASDHILFLFVFLESLELSTIPVNSRCLKYLCAIWMVVLVLFSKTDMVNEVISPTSGSSYLGRKAEGGQGNCDALWYLLLWSLNEGGWLACIWQLLRDRLESGGWAPSSSERGYSPMNSNSRSLMDVCRRALVPIAVYVLVHICRFSSVTHISYQVMCSFYRLIIHPRAEMISPEL